MICQHHHGNCHEPLDEQLATSNLLKLGFVAGLPVAIFALAFIISDLRLAFQFRDAQQELPA